MSINASWFDRQPLKRWTSRGRYLHGLNKRSPGNSLPEDSARVCWTLEKPIFVSESDSVHLSAVSVRLYFKNMTEHTHTHTHHGKKSLTALAIRSGLCGKGPNVQNSGFSKHERNFLLSLYRKTERVNERSSLSEVTPHRCQLSIWIPIFLGGGPRLFKTASFNNKKQNSNHFVNFKGTAHPKIEIRSLALVSIQTCLTGLSYVKP